MSYPGLTLPDQQWIEDSYDLYGWAAMWVYPNYIGWERHFQLYRDMVDWIKASVINYKNNAMWTLIANRIYINLRKPDDAMMFALKFGVPRE